MYKMTAEFYAPTNRGFSSKPYEVTEKAVTNEFIEDYEQAYDAFMYEMGNHEYHINYEGDWDVLSCFGLNDNVCEYEDGKDVDEYMGAMGLSPVTKAAYHDARGDFLRIADEKDWY